jgi:Tfp pilus assembly protein PilE
MTRPFQEAMRGKQRGLTLFGLLFWLLVLGSLAYVAMRVVPSVTEYISVKRLVELVAKAQPATVAEARQAFDRQKEVEFAVKGISGKDLMITKENDKVVISFAYDRIVPLYGPVHLLIKYSGDSH